MMPTSDNASMRAPRKKVVCIGINYVSRKAYPQVHGQLSGCIKDAVKISSFLSEYWRSSFQGTIEIKILRDDSSNADEIPTKNNIIKAMRWLIKDARPEDSLVFHYSGHSGQIRDRNGDEADGYEEVILPIDGDCISTNDMHELMAKPLPLGCRLVALFDTSFAKTPALSQDTYLTRKRIKYQSVQARAISFSSFKDSRISMDT
ncbi:hypothetical protein ARMSODRAFT_917948, partial [Armillaria solidipes]